MDESLQEQVRKRAQARCEYCQIPETAVRFPFQTDHIIAEQHGGATVLTNLCWACLPCNKRKGPNIAGLDNKSRKLVPLFHPRRHKCQRHCRWDGPYLRGRTAIGRATIALLRSNDPFAVEMHRTLIEEGLFPARDRCLRADRRIAAFKTNLAEGV
jgi:hypothetical protein